MGEPKFLCHLVVPANLAVGIILYIPTKCINALVFSQCSASPACTSIFPILLCPYTWNI